MAQCTRCLRLGIPCDFRSLPELWAAIDADEWPELRRAMVKSDSRNKKLLADLGRKLLHFGAENGYAKLIEALLEANVNVDTQNQYGRTALQYAALEGSKPVVRTLIAHGANVNLGSGCPPLHVALTNLTGQ